MSLKARALRWLAQREYSRAELRLKLLRALNDDSSYAGRSGVEGDVGGTAAGDASDDREAGVDALLDWLTAHRYLDERRFAESRVHARAARFGNRRIESELARHGVVLDAAASAALRASELARAQQVWAKRFGALPAEAHERARQMRFLAGRGFSAEVIQQVLRGDRTED